MQPRPIATDVAWSVCLSVGHNHEPYKNSRTDRGAVWDMNSGGQKEPCRPIRLGSEIFEVTSPGPLRSIWYIRCGSKSFAR